MVCVRAQVLFGEQKEIAQLDAMFRMLGTPTEATWPGHKKLKGFERVRPVCAPPSLPCCAVTCGVNSRLPVDKSQGVFAALQETLRVHGVMCFNVPMRAMQHGIAVSQELFPVCTWCHPGGAVMACLRPSDGHDHVMLKHLFLRRRSCSGSTTRRGACARRSLLPAPTTTRGARCPPPALTCCSACSL
jgi:hypothetical protein